MSTFAVFDALSTASTRNKLSEFVFGFHNVSIGKIEGVLGQFYVSCFTTDQNRISLIKLLVWSALMSPVCAVLGDILFAPKFIPLNLSGSAYAILVRNLYELPALFVTIFACVAIFSLPFDYWNIWVSKKLYTQCKQSLAGWRIFTDLILSMIPAMLMYVLAASDAVMGLVADFVFDRILPTNTGFLQSLVMHLLIYLPASIASSVFLAFTIRLSALVILLAVQLLLRLANLNRPLVIYTNAHEVPFTFIGLIAGMIFLIYEVI